ncbi:FAD-binding protein [Cryobacterium luteum]|uniref:FAD-binding protein n=1 Tax=Cryobacterium luteum TaxID=1424661 RepID=A0A5F0DBY8_9MICO|nr:FAD-binding protein [Cryobacterium luteum]TFB93982.1 FAD-binding protein [Cryobacterium luteum]
MTGSAGTVAGTLLLAAHGVAPAAALGTSPTGFSSDSGFGSGPVVPAGSIVKPEDRRYADLMTGNNQRFVANPDYVRLITTTEDAAAALQDALSQKKRVSVRSGGHCFADFVCNPDVGVILDLSPMTAVYYDPKMRAFAIEPGARIMNVYETLYKNWGVTIPGGICYSVGIGGHIAGGGYGLLSRAHGLTVDHLYAVEVVTVTSDRKVRTVVATRDDAGEKQDLWWAHTGGGGGNFGLITKYWFRSPGASGTEPKNQLIAAPSRVLVSAISLPWNQLDERKFARLITNFGAWHEKHSGPGTAESNLSSLFNVSHKAHGSLGMFTQVDAAAPQARRILNDYIASILEGVAIEPAPVTTANGEIPAVPAFFTPQDIPWLQATRLVGTDNPTITNPTSRGAHKSAYMNKRFSAAQIGVLYGQMTKPGFANPNTMMVLFSFGGQVNAVEQHSTANAQRRSAYKLCLQTFWSDAKDDAYYLGWERETFEGMFAATGGVPVPGEDTDGCYINYPDTDVAERAHNRSGIGWQQLYFKDNYPRLQKAKLAWDPTDFFRHKLSIELPREPANSESVQ